MNGPVAIILAAGHGKRMKSEKAKVLHEVCGQPMIRYVVDAARGAGARTIVVVVGYAADQIRDYLQGEPDIRFATQTEQLGTGHAAKTCRPLLADYQGPALILVGDEPLLRPQPLADLLRRQEVDHASCLLGTAVLPDPTGFGRILRDSAGRFLRIVEERDCNSEERAITEVNPSCYVFELPGLWDALDQIGTSNAQGEYYLTDAPEHLMAMGRKVLALNVLQPDDILGVNTRQHLAQATAIMQSRIHDHWMTEGVTIVDPRNTYIDGRCTIGQDTVIYPFTTITGRVQIGSQCRIGPSAHLRHGTVLDDGVEVGAFVEVSRSHLGKGTIVRHLAYLGDAEVGESVNIGATAVTANFDGANKNPTRIGDRSRVGAGSILVAPVVVGRDAVVGANAVVTRGHDVADGQTVVGVPARPRETDRG
ncbi:MAG: bifunctional N-acetylglucosamine-1-phosphate uridyltransferase/glucosamine-1-phosphate acetyltransferase [Isosphaeraceae bacterium]